jgi:predicted transcriptional regulator
MILNAWQKAIARTYDGGDYGYLAEQAEVSREELAECGDTLFEFLIVELGDQEDCESLEEAIRRVGRAREQLDDAIAVLEAL